MARPKKTNASYFSHDTAMRNDMKIKAIRRKFGHVGYSVWNMILEVITDSDNLELEYNDEQVELISADFDVDPEILKSIIQYFIQLKLIVNENGVLFSETLKKRLDSVFQKRKQQLERFSCTKTQNNMVFVGENAQIKENKIKEKESKLNESKENIKHDELYVFSDYNFHFTILEYFGFTEMRNPDKLLQIATFLNILNTDGKIEMFTEQFEAYKLYKEKSNTAKHAFPNFLGKIENRYMDGGWNQENWTAKLESTSKQRTDENSPFQSSAASELRKKILAGEC